MRDWLEHNRTNLLCLLTLIPGGVIFVLIPIIFPRSRPSNGPDKKS